MPNANGNVVSLPVGPDARRDRLPGPEHARRPASTARSRSGPLGVTTDEVVSGRLRRHERRPDQPRRPRQRRGGDRWRRPVRRPRHHRPIPTTTLPAGTRLRVVEQPTQTVRRRAARWSRSPGIDDPSITGYMLASDLAAARQHRPGRPRPRPGRGRSRPTATRRATPRRCAAGSPNRSPGRCASATAPATSCSQTTGTGSTFHGRLGRQGRRRSRRGRHLPGQRDRRRRLGQRRRPRATRELDRRHRRTRPRRPDPGRRARPSGSRPTATASATRSA